MFESLDEIKGIGEKVKERLLAHYGSESEALRSLENQEFENLLEAGIPLQKASEIARSIVSKRYGFSYANIMKTKEIKDIFNEIFEILKTYPRTDFAKIGVGLFYLTLDGNEINRRLAYARESAELAGALQKDKEELEVLLSRISTLNEGAPKINDVIAAEDKSLYNDLVKRLPKTTHIILIETLEDLEYLRDFEFVRYLQKNARFSSQALQLPQVEPVFEDDMDSIIPEAVLSFFGRNKESILAAAKLAEISMDMELAESAKKVQADIDAIKSTDINGLAKDCSEELMKLDIALDNLEEVAQKCLADANTTISEKTASMSLKGDEVLAMLKSAGTPGVLQNLPKDFLNTIHSTATELEQSAAEKLGLEPEWMRGIFSEETYPLEIEMEKLSEIKDNLTAEKKKLEFDIKRRLAKRLAGHIPVVKAMMRKIMELDLALSIGQFCIDYGLTSPVIQPDVGVGFNGGKNIRLKGHRVQPVSYAVGCCGLFPKHKERAVVITGANSGGKTTLLELVAQVVLMTYMGLGAPTKAAHTSLFDELYYFGKAQGTDAGAFESLLKSFESLIKTSKKRLILADEIEAITEPGAAAKILAALLDWFKDDQNTLIAMVTHLGEDIKDHTGAGVRIDGIEAKGLDKDLNLVVDRNPIMGMVARSTPELIVERLSKISSKKEFYNRILERFGEEK
jgi:energy-coupling factor transporter ATP-binding protein EcfA2